MKYYVGLNWDTKDPTCIITSTPLPKLWAAFLAVSNDDPCRHFFTIEDIAPACFKQLAVYLCEIVRFDMADRSALFQMKPMIIAMVDQCVAQFKRPGVNMPYTVTTRAA